MAWYHRLWFKFREVFFCCFKDEREKLLQKPVVVVPVEEEEEDEKKKKSDRKKSKEKSTSEERQSLLQNGDEIEEIEYDENPSSDIISVTSSDAFTSDERRQVHFARSHNRMGRYQSQRRPQNIQRERSYIVGDLDYEHAYGNGKDIFSYFYNLLVSCN